MSYYQARPIRDHIQRITVEEAEQFIPLKEDYTMDEDMLRAQEHPLAPIANAIAQGNQNMTATLSTLIERLNTPKQVIRDESGKIVGVQ